jgi:hypothetical protein
VKIARFWAYPTAEAAVSKPVSKKRRKTNITNLVRFLGGKDKYGVRRTDVFKFGAVRFLELARLYGDEQFALEHILSYVRLFRKATYQLTVEDVHEARRLLSVGDVMGS